MSFFDKTCGHLFKHKCRNIANNHKPVIESKSQPWFVINCKEKQNEFYDFLNKYRRDKSDLNRCKLVKARSDYKNIIRNKKCEYNNSQTKKLECVRYKNAKEYWKMLKGLTTPNNSKSLNTSHFADYFKSINNPQSEFFSTR